MKKRHANNKDRYKSVVFPDGNVLHETIRDDVNTIIYPKQSSISLSYWKCVLRQCDNCPKYNFSECESSCLTTFPKIKFHLYVLFSTFSLHGLIGEGKLIYNLYENEKLNCKIRSRKMLTQRELTISNFMYDVYLPSLDKFIYHVWYVQILSNDYCGKLRQNTCYYKPENVLSIRDYAERIAAKFNFELQSEYFGNGSILFIEGCIIDIVDQYLNGYMEFHYHFSDDSRHDTSTIHALMISMLTELRNNN